MVIPRDVQGRVLGMVDGPERVRMPPQGSRPYEVCQLLAMGYSYVAVTRELGVKAPSIAQTVRRYEDYILQLRRNLPEQLQEALADTMAQAFHIVKDGMTGNISLKDPRYIQAQKMVDRAMDRWGYVDTTGSATYRGAAVGDRVALSAGDEGPESVDGEYVEAGAG